MPCTLHRAAFAGTCLASLLAFATAMAATPATGKVADQPAKAPATLKFDKAGASATAKGKFKGPKDVVHDYAVPMQAGQTLEVKLSDKPGTAFSYIYRPGAPQVEGEGRKQWTIQPTVDGTYVVHVFLTKSAADKGESASYELSVTRK